MHIKKNVNNFKNNREKKMTLSQIYFFVMYSSFNIVPYCIRYFLISS